MQDEDRQTQETFDTTTGQAMAFTPPRVEDQALVPRSQAGRGLETLELARPSFESAVERFRSAGAVDVDPDDPALFNAYRRSMSYLGDMALGGLDLTDAAFKAAVGIVAQALPEDQERSFARDMVSMPEAFMGYSPGRIQAGADRVAEGVAQVGRNLQQPGPMPTLGSNLGNLAARSDEPTRTSGRVTNPLLRSAIKSTNFPDDRDGRILLEYYSPLVSAVEQMPLAREGSTGQTLMAYLTKRAPNVSSQELGYSLPNLDPNTRYTRDEVIDLLRPSTRTGFRARVLEGRGMDSPTRHSHAQRQNLKGQEEQDYFEILLENPDSEVDLPSHHDADTFAHSRGSIREDEQGRYLLIEEIQSDALQNVGDSVLEDFDQSDEWVAAFQEELFEDTPEEVLSRAFDDILNPRQGESKAQARERIRGFYDAYGIRVSGRSVRALHADGIRKLTPSFNDNPDVNNQGMDGFLDDLESSAFDLAQQKQSEAYGRGDIPFSNTQYVRQLLLANIAKAKEEGIERVVIPSITEIARLRVGTGNLATMQDAVRALQPTYVDSVRKAINTINSETQGQIRLGQQPLPYFDLTEPDQTRRSGGLLLDISNFNFDPQTQAVRFAEGGVVSMEEQMSLFDMGGLTDDGAMRDPVSGNEVPPGSMASEVRDDVPAMLSEGEYIVPADVVRFFGVRFFEDLRSQAKSGLMDMEQDGRIGGEPVDAPQDDLTPEEVAMLAEITGMAVGGMVRKGYQEGGVVAPVTQQDFMNQAQQVGGFQLPTSVFAPPQPTTPTASPFTPVTLYGPAGEVMLATSQDQSNQLLSQGYTTQPRPVLVAPVESEGGGGETFNDTEAADGGRGFSLNDENLEALRSDPFKFSRDALAAETPFSSRQVAGAGSLVAGMPGMIAGGLVGAAMELDNIAKAKAGLAVAQSRGLEGTPEFNTLRGDIDKAVDNLSGPARMLNRLGLGSGNSYAQQARTVGTTAPATAPVSTRTTTARAPTVGSDSSERFTTRTPESDRSSEAPATSPRSSARPDSGQLSSAGQASRAAAERANETTRAQTQLADIQSRESGGRNTTGRVGFEQGGLVTKPSRKKPVAKKK